MRFAWMAALCLALPAPNTVRDAPGDLKPARNTVRVERGDLELTVKLEGVLGAEPAGEVLHVPEAWTGRYVVTMAREPGSRVKAGETVLRFDARDLARRVEDARFELELARRSYRDLLEQNRLKAEEAVENLDGLRLALARAERRREGYFEITQAREEEKARLDRESSAFKLENAREELRQLEKMYAEDEMVDETEEIVLRRARWNLKYREALHRLLLAAQAFERKYRIPPREEDLERAVRLKRAALDRGLRAARIEAGKRQAAEIRARRGLDLKEREVARLVADLEAMTVRAPCDGILAHGPREGCLTRRFRPGVQVNPREPVVTILDPARPVIEATAPARLALRLAPGRTIRFTPDADGAEPGTAEIAGISRLPGDGGFRLRCRPEKPLPPALLGVRVTATFTAKRTRNALLLPAAAVRREGERTYCRVLPAPDAPPVDLDVVTGLSDGKRIVIRAGLKEGDVVLLPAGKE